jgi:hypothetical protein
MFHLRKSHSSHRNLEIEQCNSVIEWILTKLVYKSIEAKHSEGESQNEQFNKVLVLFFLTVPFVCDVGILHHLSK